MNNAKHTLGQLKVFSGKCCLCDVGVPTLAKSTWGDEIEIHTGDIVIVWHGDYIGTDSEQWTPAGGLSAVVSDQYQSFSDGTIKLAAVSPKPFVMGIAECGFSDPEWRVQVVKKFSDVVDGERWPAYGFSYAKSEAADAASASVEGGAQ